MRLLNTETLKLQDFFDEGIPSYAILSHRWESDEVSYQDLEAGKNKDGAGYRKILRCCAKALDDGHDWVWIDTCCIDKKSSAELSEAINTMFNWYQSATLCYAYLSDVEPIVTEGPLSYPTFKDSLWFTRGWTLQELISPTEVLFLDRNWSEIGTRTSLANEITAATGIPGNAYKTLDSFSVAQKMSWASKRKTSRVEDIAYSLLGLFDVNMPMLYGEGKRAFIRLQEEIIKRSDDESIFVWS
ncbi:HET-domain-containing protein, partial [Hyaloscypha variabilis F]